MRATANRVLINWKPLKLLGISCLLLDDFRLNKRGVRKRSIKPSKTFPQRSGEIEAIEVHHLGPRRHEVFHKLFLRVGACRSWRMYCGRSKRSKRTSTLPSPVVEARRGIGMVRTEPLVADRQGALKERPRAGEVALPRRPSGSIPRKS